MIESCDYKKLQTRKRYYIKPNKLLKKPDSETRDQILIIIQFFNKDKIFTENDTGIIFF